MIRGERDVVAEQQLQPARERAGDFRNARPPHQAVVHDDQVSAELDGAADQFDRCRYARDDALDLEYAFDLEAVRRVVFEALDLESRVQVTDDLSQVHGHTGRAYSTAVLNMEPSGLAVASAVVCAGNGRSDVHRARGAGPLRLLFPRAAGDAAWIVTSSLGGGLVDGDAVALDVRVEAGATAVVTTQASTKVYKGSSQQRTRVAVAGDGAVL